MNTWIAGKDLNAFYSSLSIEDITNVGYRHKKNI